MRILFLPRYGAQGASSRYRIWQYVPLFERAGHRVEVRALLDDGYLADLYKTGRRGAWWLAKGYARRVLRAFEWGRFEAMICEQEMLPFLPAFVELWLKQGKTRFFVDYDDAAYANYARWPWLRGKIARVMAAAETVVVGNNHLADYSKQFARHVCVIPTVVDLSRYPKWREAGPSDDVRVGWIGTPVTARLLKPLIPVMERLQQKHQGLSYRFIGAGDSLPQNGLRAELPSWCERAENQLLAECDIGIMPVPDDEFMRGKCGLKLIQYMASGLPVVASPVGVNREIVEEGKNGFLASSDEEWFEKLDQLIRDWKLRKSFGEAGRAKVAAKYTLEHGFTKWREILGEGDLKN